MEKLFRYLPKVFKYVFLALTFSILVMFIQSAFAKKEYEIGAFLLLAVIAIAITYLTNLSIPLKFFLPGILFLSAFVIGPILYTVVMSTFQYQTGNYISKSQAIERVQMLGIAPDEANTTFDVVVGNYNNKFAILASDPVNKRYLLSTASEKIDLSPDLIQIDEMVWQLQRVILRQLKQKR